MEKEILMVAKQGFVFKVVIFSKEKKTTVFLVGCTHKSTNKLKQFMTMNKLFEGFRDTRATVICREGDVYNKEVGMNEAINKLFGKLQIYVNKYILKIGKSVNEYMDSIGGGGFEVEGRRCGHN